MKKQEKRIFAMKAIRAAFDDSMSRHPEFEHEYSTQCWDSCENCNHCTVSQFMVTFYDHNHKRLVGNWLSNSWSHLEWTGSELIERLMYQFDVDIPHLMWNGADELLHKVRFIRIGIREEGRIEDKYYIDEKGVEYDIHTANSTRRYHSNICAGEYHEEMIDE